jgi:predicted nucleic acid-binding protein
MKNAENSNRKLVTAVIDACLVMDLMDLNTPFKDEAVKLFQAASDNRFVAMITPATYRAVYYKVHRVTHSDDLTKATLRRLSRNTQILVMPKDRTADCLITREPEKAPYHDVPTYTAENFLEMIS